MRLIPAVATLSLVLSSASAFAQSAGGVAGISGVVRDPSDAVVPHAKVVISSEARGTLRTLETNDAGLFSAPGLTPASGYNVSVTASGFTRYEAKDVIAAGGPEPGPQSYSSGRGQRHQR